MEETNGTVNLEAGWQPVANTFLEVNAVLAPYVINKHHALCRVNMSCFQCLQQGKVDILLLLAGVQVNQGTRRITTMPGTCNCCHALYITCLRCQQCIGDGLECVFAAGYLVGTGTRLDQHGCLL